MVAHAGSVGLRLLADRVGLTGELSKAMTRRSFIPVHDRGRVLVDVATMIADGGQAIADLDVLRHQDAVYGPVASPPTVWRALNELTPAALKRIDAARAPDPSTRVGPAGPSGVHGGRRRPRRCDGPRCRRAHPGRPRREVHQPGQLDGYGCDLHEADANANEASLSLARCLSSRRET